MPTAPIKEVYIQRAILDLLVWRGFLAWREQSIPVPIRRGSKIVGLRKADPHKVGMPDIFALKGGRLLAIEVKSATGKPSPEQFEWKEKLERAGALHLFARSVEEVEGFINAHKL